MLAALCHCAECDAWLTEREWCPHIPPQPFNNPRHGKPDAHRLGSNVIPFIHGNSNSAGGAQDHA